MTSKLLDAEILLFQYKNIFSYIIDQSPTPPFYYNNYANTH